MPNLNSFTSYRGYRILQLYNLISLTLGNNPFFHIGTIFKMVSGKLDGMCVCLELANKEKTCRMYKE